MDVLGVIILSETHRGHALYYSLKKPHVHRHQDVTECDALFP